MKKINILNVLIDNFSTQELLEKLNLYGGIVFTPNVDHLVKLQKNQELLEVYNSATYKVCDSQIVMYAAKYLGTPIKEKISGSDLLPKFCEYNQHNPNTKIFLLGAAEGVAKKAQENLNIQTGREIVVASYSPSFGFEKNEKECQEIVDMINKSGANVLVVGVGMPKQERWIAKYKDQLKNVKIFLALGASIDFAAGCKKRSPSWMSVLGLEWLHRLLSEPKRLAKRYLIEDLPFFWLVVQQKISLSSIPAITQPELQQEFVAQELITNLQSQQSQVVVKSLQ
ncbi:MAG TPA: WecB/TagA/CpsF family glycosyltransferase [Oculatellaceae cyanobacterium]|jgi:exopolysaccharide biosynthesis WecB/TagA/CpsF family protein